MSHLVVKLYKGIIEVLYLNEIRGRRRLRGQREAQQAEYAAARKWRSSTTLNRISGNQAYIICWLVDFEVVREAFLCMSAARWPV